ncbi:MAG TPA: hypothetical protein VEC76_20930 [Streptosporangiaceae bacterium]|nr:hypothetical protein [Streptosporangiaceae bacterium]
MTMIVMLWGISAPSYWRDESATLSATERSYPQMLAMLRHIDAVHGLYYLLLWPVVHLAGAGEFDTRLPSAMAMAAAALGVAAGPEPPRRDVRGPDLRLPAVGQRPRSRRAAVRAGDRNRGARELPAAIFDALPAMTVFMAQSCWRPGRPGHRESP